MKKFISLNQLFSQLRSRGFNTWLDRLTFFRILLIWASIIVIFGAVYYFFSGSQSYLFYQLKNNSPIGLKDSIYFSFITATSTGYGDILPFGHFKVLAIVEVVSGLLLLAFVTSKLISIKQDIILSEIYDISFNEKINRLRSSLLVFRQNLSRVINKIEEHSIRKREVNDIYIHISSLEDTLNEIVSLVNISSDNHFKKILDPMNTELLFNSVIHSFEKLTELIHLLNESKLDWKREVTLDLINRCISLNNALFDKLNVSKNLAEKTAIDLNAHKNKVIEMIKSGLIAPQEQNVTPDTDQKGSG